MNPATETLTDKQLLEVLTQSKDATAIHVNEDAVIRYANNAMLKFWDKDKNVIGLPLGEALPELRGQPFLDLFARVWREGITISGTDTPADIVVNGKLETFYFDYEYRAIKNNQGATICILHTASDVTERVVGAEREQALTEELRASNEELLSANEELSASMEELSESQWDLKRIYDDLAESDARFRAMVRQAPIGICIIRAVDLYVQDANDSFLELAGKQRDELENRTIWEAVPEAAEAYAPILKNVIETGVPFIAKEHEIVLLRYGVEEMVFVDFVYEPMYHNETVNAILVLAIDVTEKVKARQSVEEMEERIRLAVEAAEIGTFDLDLVNKEMLTSERFNTIFGFDHHVNWKEFAAVIHPDDQEKRAAAHQKAYDDGKLFYEARVVYKDASIHWIRVQGNVYYDKDRRPIRMLGTLLDITNFKQLQQQKDDFISIASHELKTPITSLKASMQMLEKHKDNLQSPLVPKLIEQSGRSIQKISALVQDLLNVSRTNDMYIRLNKTAFNISDLLSGCCNHIRIGGKYTLTVQGDHDLIITADEHAIDQVVVNFVNNAVKYAPDSLEIILLVEKMGNYAKISIKDTGPGISADKLPHLFERYYQAEPSGYQSSGLGLGLYISSEIIKRHGGEIGVDSEVGKGSIFWFTLPLS
jgi:PAS domain S-box-containing protein